jgi:lysophospholipase L1-like esterase
MNIHKKFNEIRKNKTGTEKVRVLAFGSSNTERFISGMHWFDCFELGIKNKYGRVHHCINSGIGGETSNDLLGRFESDAEFYRPDMVFITIGGNDANPEKNLDAHQFEKNLSELYSKFNAIGCFVVFQTYYAPISAELSHEHYSTFCRYMDIVREVAGKTDSGLIDHFKYWLQLEQNMPEKHRELMNDAFHVNAIGNMVLGLYIARHFKCEQDDSFYDEAVSYMELMDELNK